MIDDYNKSIKMSFTALALGLQEANVVLGLYLETGVWDQAGIKKGSFRNVLIKPFIFRILAFT